MDNDITQIFLYLYKEDFSTIIDSFTHLSEEQLWADIPESVSVGNLICHICEMEKFWIEWGFCGNEFERDRNIEFSRKGGFSKDDLFSKIKERNSATIKAVSDMNEAGYDRPREFHGETFTGETILLWHAHHLGLHRAHIQSNCRWLLKESS